MKSKLKSLSAEEAQRMLQPILRLYAWRLPERLARYEQHRDVARVEVRKEATASHSCGDRIGGVFT